MHARIRSIENMIETEKIELLTSNRMSYRAVDKNLRS